MKKVLFVVVTLEVGGIENYLLRFLHYSKEKNIEPIVLCKRGIGGELEEKYRALGVRIVMLKMYHLPILSLLKFYRFVKREKLDTICDFTGDFAGLTLTTAKKLGIKNRITFYRVSAHRFKLDFLRVRYNRFLNKLTLNNATRILSNSQSAFNFFYEGNDKFPEKFKVIKNGLPLDKFNQNVDGKELRKELNIPEDAYVIGHVGRFHLSKNHKTIIEVAHKMIEENKNIYFLLLGRGVKEVFSDREIHSNIIFGGQRHDIPNLLKAMDAFYFPSTLEGQPNALIEAMVSGLPFVASDISTIEESVPQEYYQYLVSANDVEKAASLLTDFSKNPQSKEKFKSSQEFAIANFNSFDRFEEFYNELINI